MIRYLTLLATLALSLTAFAQPPRILKVDPPNWWADMPAAMLLLCGENLASAQVRLNHGLRIDHIVLSSNGHWAQLWLADAPTHPVDITITVETAAGRTSVPFRFEPRRPAADGMAGFSPRDLMYLILTDRFADGDVANDGPLAHSAASSPEAVAERAKPRGWHGGDLRGIAQHLDYLQSLGATAIWTTPVYQNHAPEAYHGYHATDYYAVDEHYGSLADLQSLAATLHARHMKLVLDTVPNHVGPLHPWVTDEPAPDWFHGTAHDHLEAETNFDALINPHAPERDRLRTLHGWFANSLPDMNTENPAVAQYLRQNAVWWIEQTGADALRIDTFPYVDRAFWHTFTAELHSLYPHLTEVGEVSGSDPKVTSAFADGVTRAGVDTGLYTPFDFPTYHAAHDVFAGGQPMTRLARVLEADELYAHPERLLPFLDNHDEQRFAESVTDLDLQRVAYAFLLTTRGTPQLYSGDEIAMSGGNDPDNRRDFPGGFPAVTAATQDAFDPAKRTARQAALFTWIAELAKLRLHYPALSCGSEQMLLADQNTLVYSRSGTSACDDAPGSQTSTASVIVALHRGPDTPLHVDLHHTEVAACSAKSIGPAHSDAVVRSSMLDLRLGTGVAILSCE